MLDFTGPVTIHSVTINVTQQAPSTNYQLVSVLLGKLEVVMSKITNEIDEMVQLSSEEDTVVEGMGLVVDRLLNLLESFAGDEKRLREAIAAARARKDRLTAAVVKGTAAAEEAEKPDESETPSEGGGGTTE